MIKSTKILFFSFIFFNVDNPFNINNRLLKLSVVTLYIVIGGTVSQIIYLGPSFCFM